MTEMNGQNESAIEQMRAITISREYGSGGGEIATQLARRLNWKLVDHEVIVQVASSLGISEAEAEAHDEHADSLITRFLTNLGENIAPVSLPGPMLSTLGANDYNEARQRVVEAAVTAGHTIIVGRGAQVLLANRRDVLHVRVIAPLEKRIAYVMLRENLDHAAAQARIQYKDRGRANFLATVHNHSPKDEYLYDLVVNTGVLELKDVVELLAEALAKKARKLNTPAEELGPGMGLRQYPGTPGNFNLAAGPNKS